MYLNRSKIKEVEHLVMLMFNNKIKPQLQDPKFNQDLQLDKILIKIILTETLHKGFKVIINLIIINLKMDWYLIIIVSLIIDHLILIMEIEN